MRIYNVDLLGLNDNGRMCEVCGQHPHTHKWMDLDQDGFAVDCSNMEARAL